MVRSKMVNICNKYHLKFMRIFILLTLIYSSFYASGLTMNQVVSNHGSMTTTLKQLNSDFTVKVLYTGVEDDKYNRIVTLQLNQKPVIDAISTTALHNAYFVNLLSHADTQPIGSILFAPHSTVHRNQHMQILYSELSHIHNNVIRRHLFSLGYTIHTKIIIRISEFDYNLQTMQLREYILPQLNSFIH